MLAHDLFSRGHSGGGSGPCSQHVGYFKVHLEVWTLFAATLVLPLHLNIRSGCLSCSSLHCQTMAQVHRKGVDAADFPLELIS